MDSKSFCTQLAKARMYVERDIKEESEFEELDIKKQAGKRIIKVNIQRNELVPL